MTSVIESSLRAEIASMHEEIASLFDIYCLGTDQEVKDQIFRVVGLLPDDLRPPDVPAHSRYPGPFKTKPINVDDML